MHIKNSQVFHVGSLKLVDRYQRYSHEGDSLSVSKVPDTWKKIARLGGPVWSLSKPQGRFLNMYCKDVEMQLKEEAQAHGLLQEATRFRVHEIDEDDETACYSDYLTLGKAQDSCSDERNIDEVQVLVPTPTLELRYKYLRGRADITDRGALNHAAVVLAADRVSELLEGVDGLWWLDLLDPYQYSAPRGCIFQHKVHEWAAVQQP